MPIVKNPNKPTGLKNARKKPTGLNWVKNKTQKTHWDMIF
jgi:hypothetical protein